MNFSQQKLNKYMYQGTQKAAVGFLLARWRLVGNKFGLMMRMTNDL